MTTRPSPSPTAPPAPRPRRLWRRLLRRLGALYRDEEGVVMLETVLVFPLQLMVTMVIIQIAHMYVAGNVLQYASFQGTRTYALSLAQGPEAAAERGNRAAWVIASTLNNTGGGSARARMTGYQYVYPDWQSAGRERMVMTFAAQADDPYAPETIIHGRLRYWLDLTVPVGGPVIYHVLPAEKTSTRPGPHGSIGRALMRQNARLPKPWPH